MGAKNIPPLLEPMGGIWYTGVSTSCVSISNRCGLGGCDNGVPEGVNGSGGTLGSSRGNGRGGTSAIESSGTVGRAEGICGLAVNVGVIGVDGTSALA
jgi:hypothetical protein